MCVKTRTKVLSRKLFVIKSISVFNVFHYLNLKVIFCFFEKSASVCVVYYHRAVSYGKFKWLAD